MIKSDLKCLLIKSTYNFAYKSKVSSYFEKEAISYVDVRDSTVKFILIDTL